MKQLFQIVCLTFLLQHIVCKQLVNIALFKSPTQNGTLNYAGLWDVSHSVDGKTDCTYPTYQTFSGTDIVDDPWWQLDLGSIYNIQAVHVLGRQTIQPRQLVGFRLQVGLEENSLSMVYRNNDTAYNNGDIWINITMNIRIIKIDLPNDNVTNLPPNVLAPLLICEVEVYALICSLGRFGSNCTETCGHCVGGTKTCLLTDGTCPAGCVVGFDFAADNKCQTVCRLGRFGSNCTETCGHCVGGQETCLFTDGTCPAGCVVGFDFAADNTCHTECNRGQFGSNCNESCGFCIGGSQTCLVTDGICPAGCAVGYNYTTDNKCKTQNSDLDKCGPGQYGQNCEGTCGHCIDGTCSFTDGSCLAGCASGYDYVRDTSCKTECQRGFYGLNCSETCGHCIHGAATCSVIDGTCRSGCKPGYNPADKTCKTGVNILRAPDFSRNTSQSSQYLDSDSSRAIDGFKGPDPETCKCCSQTQNAEVSWWQVDIGMVLPIGEIVLYGQNGNRLSLSGFSVYLSTSVSFPDIPFVKANDDVVNVTYHIDALGNNARYVRIQRNGVLIICEVEIFLSDKTCPLNTYTVYCIPCGHCYADLPCDDITGRCPNGCETGYSGDTCNQAINTGTSYGTKDVIGAAIGGTIGGAIFILLIGMLVQRRNKLRCPWVCQTSQDYESPKPRENADDQNMYDVLDIPDLSDQSVSGSMQCTEEVNPATPHYQNTNI